MSHELSKTARSCLNLDLSIQDFLNFLQRTTGQRACAHLTCTPSCLPSHSENAVLDSAVCMNMNNPARLGPLVQYSMHGCKGMPEDVVPLASVSCTFST